MVKREAKTSMDLMNRSSDGGKRLSARIGRDFQVKVPKFGASVSASSTRPAPIKMSVNHAHLTMDEEAGFAQSEGTKEEAGKATFVEESTTQPRRGGQCLHQRAQKKQSNIFVDTAEKLIFPYEAEPTSIYFQKMISSSQAAAVGSRVSGRNKKRKAAPESANWAASLKICGEPIPRSNGGIASEEDEAALLEYLQVSHQGNVEAAEMSVRVRLSNGASTKSRRINIKKSTKGGNYWRHQVERTKTGMLGDLREDTSLVAYPRSYQVVNTNPTAGSDLILGDPIGVWRSTLECSQFIEARLGEEPSDDKLSLFDILKFVRASCGLPSPEESFGTRHVSVERISDSFSNILDQVSKTRCTQAELLDLLVDCPIDIEETQTWLDDVEQTSSVSLGDEVDIVRRLMSRTLELQSQLNSTQSENKSKDDVSTALSVVEQVNQFGLRSREIVDLEKRLAKHSHVERRLQEWETERLSGKTSTLKVFAAFERDIKRLDLVSPRTKELLELAREIDDWVDRAQIAVRSRMALSEIELLIGRAKELPLNLSEYLDKLQSRVVQARTWIERLAAEVPPALDATGTAPDQISWSQSMRKVLMTESAGHSNGLLDLVCEGARIPVEINYLTMLQVEIDAKNWIIKAKKWTKSPETSAVKGRIEELRDHLKKAALLRDRLPVEMKEKWVLDHEEELQDTVSEADTWMEEFQVLLDSDHRDGSEACVSMKQLRTMVSRGEAINASIGNQLAKLNRILDQAETWCVKHSSVLTRGASGSGLVSLPELTNAVTESASVSVDLEEAQLLRDMLERIQTWLERTGIAAPIKRSKRVGGRWGSKVVRFTVKEMIGLINEARALPIDASDEIARLKSQLENVHKWRIGAHEEILNITSSLGDLKVQMQTSYQLTDDEGLPSYSSADKRQGAEETDVEAKEAKESADAADDSDDSVTDYDLVTNSLTELQGTVSSLEEESHQFVVLCSEAEIVHALQDGVQWCSKCHELLQSPSDLFTSKKHQKFDSFIESGQRLIEHSLISDETDKDLMNGLFSAQRELIQDQLGRLTQIRVHRDKFVEWSKSASIVIDAKEKSLTIQAIELLVKESQPYPSNTDIVRKIVRVSQQVDRWQESVAQIASQTGDKITLQEALQLSKEADSLKLLCDESKVLKSAIRSARGWLSRIKKCKVEQGLASTSDMEDLIGEHDELLISLPDELEKVREGLKGYCVCRRPYEGFMIGCDGCDEWYHGTCIGLSKSQADRYDRFLCVRCCVKSTFTSSTTTLANIVRKWTSEKELKKIRLSEHQKSQRKIRKEKKDMEKYVLQVSEVRKQLELTSTIPAERPLPMQALTSGTPVGGPVATEILTTHREETASSVTAASLQINQMSVEAPRVINTCKTEASQVSTVAIEQSNIGDPIPMEVEPILENPEAGPGTVGEKEAASASDEPQVEPATQASNQELNTKLGDLLRAIDVCNDRLQQLGREATDRQALDTRDYERRELLKIWCIRLRATVLVPGDMERATQSRPSSAGVLSFPMLNLFKDAEALQIAKLPDVHLVANSLKCIAWSSLAMTTLTRKPTLEQIHLLIARSSSLQLPDEKAVRMLKSMAHRTSQWQIKARKALVAKPGEKRSVSLDLLNDVSDANADIPCDVPEATFLSTAIEDKGRRHCVCGGLNIGTEMVCCEKCKTRFHCACVQIGAHSSGEWLCSHCSGGEIEVTARHFEMLVESPPTSTDPTTEAAPEAPTIEKLWPPFGLFGSEKSREVLGDDCLLIPDEAGQVLVPPHTRPEHAAAFLQQLLAPPEQAASTQQLLEASQTVSQLEVQPTMSQPTVAGAKALQNAGRGGMEHHQSTYYSLPAPQATVSQDAVAQASEHQHLKPKAMAAASLPPGPPHASVPNPLAQQTVTSQEMAPEAAEPSSLPQVLVPEPAVSPDVSQTQAMNLGPGMPAQTQDEETVVADTVQQRGVELEAGVPPQQQLEESEDAGTDQSEAMALEARPERQVAEATVPGTGEPQSETREEAPKRAAGAAVYDVQFV